MTAPTPTSRLLASLSRKPQPTAAACWFCDRDAWTCRRIPGRCCGACNHETTTREDR